MMNHTVWSPYYAPYRMVKLTRTGWKKNYTFRAKRPPRGRFTLVRYNFLCSKHIHKRFAQVCSPGFTLWLGIFICTLNLLILESWRTLLWGVPLKTFSSCTQFVFRFSNILRIFNWNICEYTKETKKMKLKPQFSSRRCKR